MRTGHRDATAAVAALAVLWTLGGCAPDLAVRNLHAAPFTTQSQALKATIVNQGKKAAPATSGSVTTTVVGSPPTTSSFATPALAPGGTFDWMSVYVPPDPGTCKRVTVCTDASQQVGESQEGNNCATASFPGTQLCPTCDQCCAEQIPAFFDWRNRNSLNWLSPVKDQDSCGSCWAFAAIGLVEAANNVEASGSPLPNLNLSEQNLVSCGGAGDCGGGWAGLALTYVRTTGVVDETTLPYASGSCGMEPCAAACSCASGSCSSPCACAFTGTPRRWRVQRVAQVQTGTLADRVTAVKRALMCRGPLLACSTTWSHCIVIVGWMQAVASVPESWIIKNSWGTGWGAGGYGLERISGGTHSDLAERVWYVEDVQ